jgi:hypothetical protein
MTRAEGLMRAAVACRASRWVALSCALSACGAAEEAPVLVGGGEVAAPWDGYCVATFNEDHAFVDPFGDVELQVEAGSRYLLADVASFGAAGTILYLTAKGPVEFEVDDEGGAAPPFTSSCGPGRVESLVGAFTDVSVYADEGLTMAACMLAAGSAFSGGGLSYALVSGDLFSGGGTYQVWFGGLATACGGLDTGYIEASSAMLGNTEHTVLPLASVTRAGP